MTLADAPWNRIPRGDETHGRLAAYGALAIGGFVFEAAQRGSKRMDVAGALSHG